MSLQTSTIVKGLLAGAGLLAGGGAMAGITSSYAVSESGYVFHYTNLQGSNIDHFSNANIANIIVVFNYAISEKLMSAHANSLQSNWWLAAWDKSNDGKKSGRFENRYVAAVAPAAPISLAPSATPVSAGPVSAQAVTAQPVTSVPEPMTLSLLGLGLVAVGFTRRKLTGQ